MERWVALGSFRVYDSRAPRKRHLASSQKQQKRVKLETTHIRSLYVQYVQYQLDNSTYCREILQQSFLHADLVAAFCEQLMERVYGIPVSAMEREV